MQIPGWTPGGARNQRSPAIARVSVRAAASRALFLAEEQGVRLRLWRASFFRVALPEAGSCRPVLLAGRLVFPEAGGARGGAGSYVSDWGPRPGRGRRSATASPPCRSVTFSRSPSLAAAATFYPSAGPFLFCWRLPRG
jgi:hypothetical protein